MPDWELQTWILVSVSIFKTLSSDIFDWLHYAILWIKLNSKTIILNLKKDNLQEGIDYTVRVSSWKCGIGCFQHQVSQLLWRNLLQSPEVLQMIHRCSWFEDTDVFSKSCVQIEFPLIESYLGFILGKLAI